MRCASARAACAENVYCSISGYRRHRGVVRAEPLRLAVVWLDCAPSCFVSYTRRAETRSWRYRDTRPHETHTLTHRTQRSPNPRHHSLAPNTPARPRSRRTDTIEGESSNTLCGLRSGSPRLGRSFRDAAELLHGPSSSTLVPPSPGLAPACLALSRRQVHSVHAHRRRASRASHRRLTRPGPPPRLPTRAAAPEGHPLPHPRLD